MESSHFQSGCLDTSQWILASDEVLDDYRDDIVISRNNRQLFALDDNHLDIVQNNWIGHDNEICLQSEAPERLF